MDVPLIEAVKSNPCLYNKRSLTYKNKLRREVAWLEVAAAVGSNVESAQQRWKGLRDRFVREMKKIEKNGQSDREIKWKYAPNMMFLRFYLKATSVNEDEKEWNNQTTPIENIDNEPEHDEDDNYIDEAFFIPKLEHNEDSETTISQPNEYDETSIEVLNAIKVDNDNLRHNDNEKIDELVEFDETTDTNTPTNNQTNIYTDVTIERITTLVERLTELLTNQVENEGKSRNLEFLKVLDSYLLRLPDDIQDDVKIELLNLVYNKHKLVSRKN